MIIYKKKKDIQNKINSLKEQGKRIGFVPTMGALHKGHISLIEACNQQNDITICSIFINPTQFNDLSDFNKYPVTIETDILQLTEAGTDILFLPAVKEMYPEGIQALQHYHLGELENILEGEYRPGHFQGVCNVVHKLFTIVQPHEALFGQKDYQQCMVIKKLIVSENLPVEIIIHPTVRESNGLAMSSRNLRLREDEKTKATALYQVLLMIKNNVAHSNFETLIQEAKKVIAEAGFSKIDYIEIRNADTLTTLPDSANNIPAVALIAAYMNEVRLIDNMLL